WWHDDECVGDRDQGAANALTEVSAALLFAAVRSTCFPAIRRGPLLRTLWSWHRPPVAAMETTDQETIVLRAALDNERIRLPAEIANGWKRHYNERRATATIRHKESTRTDPPRRR